MELVKTILLCLSAFMVWETFSRSTFTAFVMRPIRDWLEVSYFAAIVGSILFLGIAIAGMVRRPHPIGKNVLRLVMALSWCLILSLCLLFMGFRTAI